MHSLCPACKKGKRCIFTALEAIVASLRPACRRLLTLVRGLLQKLKSKIVQGSRETPDTQGGSSGGGDNGRKTGNSQHTQHHQQQQHASRHGGLGGGVGSRPESRGPPPPPPGRGGQAGMWSPGQRVQQQMQMRAAQQSFLGGGMQGGARGGMQSGGGMGGGGMDGWAGVNPAAARAMLLAQQQGQPWGNEQLPMFQNVATGAEVDAFMIAKQLVASHHACFGKHCTRRCPRPVTVLI